jgi:hypothetical protein
MTLEKIHGLIYCLWLEEATEMDSQVVTDSDRKLLRQVLGLGRANSFLISFQGRIVSMMLQ